MSILGKFSKISINIDLGEIFEKYRFGSNFRKFENFDFGEIFEKFQFWSKFLKISILVKFSKNFVLVEIYENCDFVENF